MTIRAGKTNASPMSFARTLNTTIHQGYRLLLLRPGRGRSPMGGNF